MTLSQMYTNLLRGDIDSIFEESNLKEINDTTQDLLNRSPNWDIHDIDNADTILRISNIIYNNTDIAVLPLEDGIYDLLLEAYKVFNPNFQVGANVVQFKLQGNGSSDDNKYVEALIEYPREVNDMIYTDTFIDISRNRWQQPFDSHHDNVSDRGRDTAHKYPQLVGTLDKCKFVTEAEARKSFVDKDPKVKIFERDFIGKHIQMGLIPPNSFIDLVAEIKYDGLSIEAEVNNKIVSARTRGDLDNDLATDLTDVLYGYRFPNNLGDDEVFGMKFEAIITKEDMIYFQNATGKTYKNMRTAIAGILGSANAREYINYITLVPLATSLEFNNRIEELEFMNRYFATKEPNRYKIMSGYFSDVIFQVDRFVKEADYFRGYMPFAYDGIVVSYLDKQLIQSLGRENHVNKYSIAIKFNAMTRQTRFRGYRYTVGKNGVITPMIMFDPVEFNGTIHNMASGHSYERFKMLALKYNDIIDVEYVNDVMPYVKVYDCIENENNPRPIEEFIDHCPSCGSVLTESVSGRSVVCTNPSCPAKGIARMTDMLKKINFRDFSEATVIDLGITSFTDLITIDYNRLSKLGKVNADKFMERVKELTTKEIYDYNIIGALGFTDVAAKGWKLILNKVRLEEIINLDDHELSIKLSKIKGIGEVTIKTILEERSIYIHDLLTITKMDNVKRTYMLNDTSKKVVITGFRDQDFQDKVSRLGFTVSDSGVTRDTNILVIPYKGFSSSKVTKALNYGVQIETLDDFCARFNIN